MLGDVSSNENKGRVQGIHHSNRMILLNIFIIVITLIELGPGIQIASIPELGPGGSWSTWYGIHSLTICLQYDRMQQGASTRCSTHTIPVEDRIQTRLGAAQLHHIRISR